MPHDHWHRDSFTGHGDRDLDADSAVAPPLYQSSSFRAASQEDFNAMSATPRHDRYYTRDGNPTFSRVERLIAGLEGAEAALLTASGMGAISATILTLVSQGDHVIAQKTHYMGTAQLLAQFLPRFGITVTLVDQTHPDSFAAAVRPTTKLIVVETPVNPLLAVTDLKAVAALAQSRGLLSLCDSTIGTPINQRPLEWGIDLVVHSATKYLGGHHDLMAGVVAGASALIERVWHSQVMLGPVPDPFAAWLLLRGIRTLPVRIERQNRTALHVAKFLSDHAGVQAVHYPGLPGHPQHELARRQMPGGFGGLLSFDLRGGAPAAERFLAALRLPSRAVSFGGFESLATWPAGMWAGSVGAEAASAAGIGPGLIRLAIGLEHEADLVADLDRSLRESGAD